MCVVCSVYVVVWVVCGCGDLLYPDEDEVGRGAARDRET